MSAPAWRGYDLLPVLRERDENRGWDDADPPPDPKAPPDDAADDAPTEPRHRPRPLPPGGPDRPITKAGP
jgi:hypothetical protein